jgi:hypothetical protein
LTEYEHAFHVRPVRRHEAGEPRTLIAAADLALLVFASGLRNRIAAAEPEPRPLAALAGAGAIASAALLLAGNAVSRATAFAAMSEDFVLDPNTRRLAEDAGLLLLASGAIAAMLLVIASSIAGLRHGVLPRSLAWAGFPAALSSRSRSGSSASSCSRCGCSRRR